MSYQAERKVEEHYRSLFRKTGLLIAGTNDVSALFERAAEHVSPAFHGENAERSPRANAGLLEALKSAIGRLP